MKRRRVLRASAIGIATLAGCTAGDSSSDPTDTATRTDTSTPTATSTPTDSPTPSPTPTESPTPTATPEPTSEFRGPTTEDTEFVDLQYRDYTDAEIAEITSNAETIPYRDLLRNADDYRGRAVTYEAGVGQLLEGDAYDALFLVLGENSDNIAYASWTGDRYIRGDVIRCWGQVLGTESYVTGQGSQITVPALALADIQLLNG